MTKFASALALLVLSSAGLGCSVQLDGEASGQGSGKASGVDPSVTPLATRVRETPSPTSHCTPAPQLLDSAVCVCNGIDLAGSLTTRSSSGLTADVGVEGNMDMSTGSSIAGKLRVTGALSFAGDVAVSGDAWARGGVSLAGSLSVGGDLACGADFEGAGNATIAGALRAKGRESFAGEVRAASRAAYVPETTTPCGCDPSSFYDVGAAVAAARTTNDNAKVGWPAAGDDVPEPASERTVSLPTGRYYVKSLASVGDLVLRAEGSVLLYVDGDVDLVGAAHVAIAPGASLDLFVAGSFRAVGDVALGEPERPEALRLYVGADHVDLTGSHAFRGLVYAPRAEVSIAGDTSIHGALFAGSLAQAGSLDVDFAAVTKQNVACEEPGAAPPTLPAAPAPAPALR